MEPGTRCYTPTGRQGTAQPPLWLMPVHTLVRLDSGELLWFLTEILTAGEAPMAPKKKRASGKRKAPKREKVTV